MSLIESDFQYRKHMEEASAKLAKAINMLRDGIIMVTPTRPYRLPPSGNERGASGQRLDAVRAAKAELKHLPLSERCVALHQLGFTVGQIASAHKMSPKKVQVYVDRMEKQQ